ncbi:MAG: acylneuraminate cytidylyltransferase family protein [Rhodospirillaceae bacterium]|jgi:CMP-N,N'-diacetyllegionaminic acid synthase|nr:acylneuraminate cytidylyltransferase family protein [Rhodospirillaceae bacterium]MBT5190892.1 acylneuraminate cytidylyltransferase family protein [Rhodospirillaceae bacterium]MBT5898749.1 acylneuraminate cytidylyltransferase family protein [Rhodospirillaceae bacterium]MBT6426563.1 acylneuraminate cytidylyltransferase family protein [Rhodospirillaceae bacterium]MBT7760143.1 acylneuraminate cytidylyltransferase family protein [Rhodospirillaceae bacterium]
MAMDGQTVLAVVPARGGSKSIPRKNLAMVGGISLVGRAGQLAAGLDWIDRAIISTNDVEIAAEATRHGLEAPFQRPDDLAGDKATSTDMWRHAWLAAEEHYAMSFDISVLLEPTSPMRRADDVTLCVRTLIDSGHKAAATLSPTPAHFTPNKTLKLDGKGNLAPYLEDGRTALRQSIPDYYHCNGICYALRRKTLVDEGHIMEDDCIAVIIDRPIVNIDEPFELELAEWLLARETNGRNS